MPYEVTDRRRRARADTRPGGELRSFDRLVASVETPTYFGLTVSPDRKAFLLTARKPPDVDLMLIENFR